MPIIIIGAGASGLVAGKRLAGAGHDVIVLEAKDRLGGRIYSTTYEGATIERGAEFIHGKLPVTMSLLKEAGIPCKKIEGDYLNFHEGRLQPATSMIAGEDILLEKLSQLTDNISLAAFLDRELSGTQYAALRKSVTSYVQGYYAADPAKLSALQFYKEWQNEDEDQFRVEGGYASLINYLEADIIKHKGKIYRDVVVSQVQWEQGKVSVTTTCNREFNGEKLLLTFSLGVWQQEQAVIQFRPSLPMKSELANQLCMGEAMKIFLHFDRTFWKEQSIHRKTGIDTSSVAFIFSTEIVPTFWVHPHHSTITGWVAGPAAAKWKNTGHQEIIHLAMASLSTIFNTPLATLQTWLSHASVTDWSTDPFIAGAYAYTSVAAVHARRAMREPVGETLFFAGEGLYEGTETGTVEAALTSGIVAAEEIMKSIALKNMA